MTGIPRGSINSHQIPTWILAYNEGELSVVVVQATGTEAFLLETDVQTAPRESHKPELEKTRTSSDLHISTATANVLY